MAHAYGLQNGVRSLLRQAPRLASSGTTRCVSTKAAGQQGPDVRAIAKMAQMQITDEEVADWQPKINSIVDWFGQLQAVDVAGVPPAIHAVKEGNVLRTDAAAAFPERVEVLAMVPDKEGAFAKVPKIATGADTPTASTDDAAAAASTSSNGSSAAAAAVELGGDELAQLQALDLRVGRILSCEPHPDADSLYVEKIDVGEAEPRTIVSGLVKYVPLEAMQQRPVVVLCNLKARNMRGIKSFGMLLAASNDAHDVVEPLVPPEGAAPGSRIWFGAHQDQAKPFEPNQIQKKKVWEGVQPQLRTDDQRRANYKGVVMMCEAGAITSEALTAARIG